jgi:sec-independent protein translocase protein TatA
MGSLGGWEILIILVVLVALFGAKRLPDMARSIGQSARVFKGEMKGMRDDDDKKPEQAPRVVNSEVVSTDKVEGTRPASRPETPGTTAS